MSAPCFAPEISRVKKHEELGAPVQSTQSGSAYFREFIEMVSQLPLRTASCPAPPTFYNPSRIQERKRKEVMMSQRALHINHSSLEKMSNRERKRCTNQKLRKSFKIFTNNEHGDIRKGK